MVEYFVEEELKSALKQRKKVITAYYIVLGIFLLSWIGMYFFWFRTLPYMSPQILTVKIILYVLTALMVIFSFIYLGIVYKRVNKFCRLAHNLLTGIRETSILEFVGYSDMIQGKDGVDCKALIFLEWNKYKQEYFKRKVLVLAEKEFPKFEKKQTVKVVTQGNVLVKYEILN